MSPQIGTDIVSLVLSSVNVNVPLSETSPPKSDPEVPQDPLVAVSPEIE